MRRVVVTGARGGIGRAAAAAFAQRGWRVIGQPRAGPGPSTASNGWISVPTAKSRSRSGASPAKAPWRLS